MWKSSAFCVWGLLLLVSSPIEAWSPHFAARSSSIRTAGDGVQRQLRRGGLRHDSCASTTQTNLFFRKVKDANQETNGTITIRREKHATVVDAEIVEKQDMPKVTEETISKSERGSLKSRIESMMAKPRAYPLFLAEKAAELVDSSIEGIAKRLHLNKDDNGKASAVKERVVVLGTGWGGAVFLSTIDTDVYDVTVISPRNHFVFTPMLAGASVGTVEVRSICQPIREFNRKARFLEGIATSIDPRTRTVKCISVDCEGNACDTDEFDVTYDRLVVTVGARVNTFGIKGVPEHCNFLKQIEDARRIRTSLVNCFEHASLPNQTDEQRTRELTFVVIGAGPTGVEFASELRDFVEQDGPKYYPDVLKYVRIKVIEATNTVLATFDKSLQEEAVNRLLRPSDNARVRELLPPEQQMTELILDNGVMKVDEHIIHLKDGTKVPYGLAVWAGGNCPLPLTLELIKSLGDEQGKEQIRARGRIAVDPWLRAIGGDGRILAFGDCASILDQAALPSTGQVAAQQGEFLAKMMNHRYDLSPAVDEEGTFPPPLRVPDKTVSSIGDSIASFALHNHEFAKPFQFLNLGILAYTSGGSALAQISPAPNAPPLKGKGKIGNALWKSVYFTKQASWRNRLLVWNDWITHGIFGRDITRL